MQTFDALRAETLTVFPTLADMARRSGSNEAVRRLEAAQERLHNGRLTAVVCGEFKRGKSSLLNALLEEPGLLPVDTAYATNVVIAVTYGDLERIVVRVEDRAGGLEERLITRAEVQEYASESGNPRNVRRARLITIETPNPRLASGLTFVDTPGIGGVYEEHSVVTAGFLPTADALLFVTDATQPLLQGELTFLRKAIETAEITEDADGVLCVLTKIDAVGDFTALYANTCNKIAEVTGRSSAPITVVPVSARAKLAALESGSTQLRESSNFAELEEVLWAALARRRAATILGDALAELQATAESLLGRVKTELTALADLTTEQLAELEAEVAQRESRFTELGEEHAAWRGELRTELLRLGEELQRKTHDELEAVWARFAAMQLDEAQYIDDPDKLVLLLEREVATVVGTLNTLAARSAARVLREFSGRIGVQLGERHLAKLPDPPVPDLPSDPKPTAGAGAAPETRRLRKSAEAMSVGGVLGGALGVVTGTAVGTLFGPGPGTAAGSAAGYIVGAHWGSWLGTTLGGLLGAAMAYRETLREGKRQEGRARHRQLQSILKIIHEDQGRHIQSALADLIETFVQAVMAELDSRITRERESVADVLRRMYATRKATEFEANARRAELTGQREPLESAVEWINRLNAEMRELCLPSAESLGRVSELAPRIRSDEGLHLAEKPPEAF